MLLCFSFDDLSYEGSDKAHYGAAQEGCYEFHYVKIAWGFADTVIGVVTLKPPMAPVPAPAPCPNVDVVPNAAFRLKTLSFILLPILSPTSVKAFSLAI